MRDGGLLIDLSTLRGVTVDPVRRVAEAAGGATVADVAAAAAPYGLVPVAGTVGGVGPASPPAAGTAR